MTDERTCRCKGQFAMHKPALHADRDGSECQSMAQHFGIPQDRWDRGIEEIRARMERERERALAAYVPEGKADLWEDFKALAEQIADTRRRAEKAEAALARVEAHPVLFELADERARQKAKHGDQSHLPDGTGPRMAAPSYGIDYRDNYAEYAKGRCKRASQNEGGDGSITFEHILTEEWAEAIAESDPVALRAELVQVAAVAVQWIEAIDIRAALADPKAAS